MTAERLLTVGPKGQVVIPKNLREELSIKPGDRMHFWREGDHVAGARVGTDQPLLGRFRGSSLTADLADERAAERIADSGR